MYSALRRALKVVLMSTPSLTHWINELQAGSDQAARILWQHLHKGLLELAQKQLAETTPTGFDEEDVVLSAFNALCDAIRQGRYDIGDRNELWRMATVIVVNRAYNRLRDEKRLRRGGGRKRKPSSVLESLVCPKPDATTVLMMQEECQHMLAKLKTPDLEMVALLKVEGHTDEQVAEKLGCSRRTVQRRLSIIRKLWA